MRSDTPSSLPEEQPDQARLPDRRYGMADSFHWTQNIASSLPADIIQDRHKLQYKDCEAAEIAGNEGGFGRPLAESFLPRNPAVPPSFQLCDIDAVEAEPSQGGPEEVRGPKFGSTCAIVRVGLPLAD